MYTSTPPDSALPFPLLPAFSGEKYYVINNNKPFFTDDEIVTIVKWTVTRFMSKINDLNGIDDGVE